MNLHVRKVRGFRLLRALSAVSFLCITFALAAYPVDAAAARPAAPVPTPTTEPSVAPVSSTPGVSVPAPCNPKLGRCSNGPVVSPDAFFPGVTSQFARGKTSVSYCNSRLYVAWTGSDDHVNVAWGSTGGGFTNVVTFSDTTYMDFSTNPTTYTSPALACWRPATGTYSDATRLWIFFTGTNKLLYYGYFSGNASDNVIHVHATVPSQSSVFSPATAVAGGTLRLVWRGNTTNFVYMERTDDAATWFNFNHTDSSITADGGPGAAWYCPPGQSCNPWIAWIGTDSPIHHINLGYFDLNAGVWIKVVTTADFSGKNDDLTLVPNGSTLYLPYAGASGIPTLQVDTSTNGSSWSNSNTVWDCIWGAGGAIAPGGHLWLFWPESSDTQILVGQWN